MIVLSPVSANRPASDTGSSCRVARRFTAALCGVAHLGVHPPPASHSPQPQTEVNAGCCLGLGCHPLATICPELMVSSAMALLHQRLGCWSLPPCQAWEDPGKMPAALEPALWQVPARCSTAAGRGA